MSVLVVIDAAAVNGGPLARSLETASRAAAACGSDVHSVRLHDTYGHLCIRCMACARGSRRCVSRDGGLAALASLMRSADAVLVGAPSRLFGGDPVAKALLIRLVRAFAEQPEVRCSAPVASRGGAGKLAAVVASCTPPSLVTALAGQMVGTAGTAWRTLADCGVHIVGTAALPGAWSGAGAMDGPLSRSHELGRMLAAPRRVDDASSPARAHLVRPVGV